MPNLEKCDKILSLKRVFDWFSGNPESATDKPAEQARFVSGVCGSVFWSLRAAMSPPGALRGFIPAEGAANSLRGFETGPATVAATSLFLYA
jgi:hypothetical protein